MTNEVKMNPTEIPATGDIEMPSEIVEKKRRKRRSPEEIAAEKAAKEARKAEREAKKKAAEESAKKPKTSKKSDKKDEKDKDVILEDTLDDIPDSCAKKEPSKRAGAKKSNGQKPIIQKKGQWSDPNNSLHLNELHVEIMILEDALGTSPSDPDIMATYISSNAPDAASKEEEIAAVGEAAVLEKGTTIFCKGYFNMTENGQKNIDILDIREARKYKHLINKKTAVKKPFFWNYQLRGFFKDSCGLLGRANYGESADLKAYKKVIDGGILVSPRRIAIDLPETYFGYDTNGELVEFKSDVNNLPILSRPLLISGPTGSTTAIARSEYIPAGSTIKFTIKYADPKMLPAIYEWLNYGCEHGLGAWRNSGRGIFCWREINPDYSPIEIEEEEA